jgi:nucleotide-binding universal stress UspA family protein
MTTALEHRLAEIDRELATGRSVYERMRARTESKEYADEMLEALARIADILQAPTSERQDFQALVMVGRIAEIVDRFGADLALLGRYDGLKAQRQRIERGLA